MFSDHLADFIVCPETKQRLRLATAEENARAKVERGLIREDGQVVYPIVQEIPMLLVEHGVKITPPGAGGTA